MASAIEKTLCFTCDKVAGRVTCKGCSKIYCKNHFEDHQQELSHQFDEVELTRDLFRQSLTDKTTNSHTDPLIEQIDQWENESINKIRQAADESRQILFRHMEEMNTRLEGKLHELTNQLRQSRKENDYSEMELNQWREQLEQMRNELMKSPLGTIQQDLTPLVTKIKINITDPKEDEIPNTITNISNKETKDQERSISCSFCHQEFPTSEAMGEHLMLCGNKTRKCRNCRKLIRQAVFAYHCANNCADPDTPFTNHGTNNDAEKHNQRQQLSETAIIPCEFCNKPVSYNTYEDHRKLCFHTQALKNLPQPPLLLFPVQPTNTTTMITPTTKCVYCSLPILNKLIVTHLMICTSNPNRRRIV